MIVIDEDRGRDTALPTRTTGVQGSSEFGAKANFIRSQPESMSAKEVIEAASKLGMSISLNHVYNLRRRNARQAIRDAKQRAANTPDNVDVRPVTNLAHVERLVRLGIAEVGLQRARELFEEVAAAFRG